MVAEPDRPESQDRVREAEFERLLATSRKLLRGNGALQSSAGGGVELDAERIEAAVRAQVHNDILRRRATAAASPSAFAEALETNLAEVAGEAVRRTRVALELPVPRVSRSDMAALQLIVRTFGRPALGLPAGRIENPANTGGDNEAWLLLIVTRRSILNARARSVGALFGRDGGLVGTGWRVGGDLIVTNRHVAKLLAANPDEAPDRYALPAGVRLPIDFDYNDGVPPGPRSMLDKIVYCASEDWLDLAVLRIDPAGVPAPPPVEIRMEDGDLAAERRVYVIGHPFATQWTEDVETVFGRADGFKRFAPGEIIGRSGTRFEHDCSTLHGNSGSCVFSVDRHEAIGLHFGGRDPDATETRGTANLAIPLAALRGHPAGALLGSGGTA